MHLFINDDGVSCAGPHNPRTGKSHCPCFKRSRRGAHTLVALDFNDPYVPERMLAAAYGTTLGVAISYVLGV